MENSAAVTSSQRTVQMLNLHCVLDTLYGRKNSLLARRKLDRLPYLQYSTTTISGPKDVDSLIKAVWYEHSTFYNVFQVFKELLTTCLKEWQLVFISCLRLDMMEIVAFV